MKTIELLSSIQDIKFLLKDVYNEIVYDHSPPLNEFNPEGVWFVLLEDLHSAGIINLINLNNVVWMPHIVIYKEYRGNGSEEWGKKVVKAMKKAYGVEKLLAFTPYESAKKYAEKVGFKQIAILTKSIQKNGELLDQYILEKLC